MPDRRTHRISIANDQSTGATTTGVRVFEIRHSDARAQTSTGIRRVGVSNLLSESILVQSMWVGFWDVVCPESAKLSDSPVPSHSLPDVLNYRETYSARQNRVGVHGQRGLPGTPRYPASGATCPIHFRRIDSLRGLSRSFGVAAPAFQGRPLRLEVAASKRQRIRDLHPLMRKVSGRRQSLPLTMEPPQRMPECHLVFARGRQTDPMIHCRETVRPSLAEPSECSHFLKNATDLYRDAAPTSRCPGAFLLSTACMSMGAPHEEGDAVDPAAMS
jgi:hypothetical protein